MDMIDQEEIAAASLRLNERAFGAGSSPSVTVRTEDLCLMLDLHREGLPFPGAPARSEGKRIPVELEDYALGLLDEEMCETGQMSGKWRRFGPDHARRDGLTARRGLSIEAGDLLAALSYAIGAGILDLETMSQQRDRKLAKLLDPNSRDDMGDRLAPELPAPPPVIGVTPRHETRSHRDLVEEWAREHLGCDEAHWGDTIAWATARDIADRFDEHRGAPLAQVIVSGLVLVAGKPVSIERIEAAFSALRTAAQRFRDYQRDHQRKADELDGSIVNMADVEQRARQQKADRNRDMAEMCEAPLQDMIPSGITIGVVSGKGTGLGASS